MKNKLLLVSFLVAAFAFAFALVLPVALHAQTPAADPSVVATDAPPALVTTAENFATPFIVSFAQAHAWLATLIAIIGTLRLVAKPITTAVEIYVKNSPSTADDAALEKVEHSFAWKVLFWLLDFGASIKAGSQFTATPKS